MSGKESAENNVLGGKRGEYHEPSPWQRDTPYFVYFYYSDSWDKSGTRRLYTWQRNDEGSTKDPINESELLSTIIPSLVRNARRNGSAPSPCGWALKDVAARRISWLVVAVDASGGAFPYHGAVSIKYLGGRKGNSTKPPGDGENHSFFDGKEGDVDVDGKSVQLVWMRNHVKTDDGTPLVEDEEEYYQFDFYSPDPGIFPDESGTNMGPVVGPP